MRSIKKTILLMCLILLASAGLIGCGGDKKGESAAKTDYLGWTSDDWAETDENQKKACAVAYTEYTAEFAGIEDGKRQAENMGDDEIREIVSALDALFQVSGDKTLQEFIDKTMGTSEE